RAACLRDLKSLISADPPRRDLPSFPTRRSSDLYGVGPGALPPDLRRCRRDHVFRDCLRDVAAHHRQAAALEAAGTLAVVVVVHRSEEHTSELQSLTNLVCRLLLAQQNNQYPTST